MNNNKLDIHQIDVFYIDKEKGQAYLKKLNTPDPIDACKAIYENSIITIFGDILFDFEQLFPSNNRFDIQYIVNSVLSKDQMKLYGLPIKPTSLNYIYSLIEEGPVILTLDTIEQLRLNGAFTIKPQYIDANNIDKGYYCEVKSLTDVLLLLIYYYAVNGYKLVRCPHCERWFATSDLKTEYCPRKSPIKKYSHLSCYDAVQNIRQVCKKKRRSIEVCVRNSVNGQNSVGEIVKEKDLKENKKFNQVKFLNDFSIQCDKYYAEIKNRWVVKPSADNLTVYLEFLDKVKKERGWLK